VLTAPPQDAGMPHHLRRGASRSAAAREFAAMLRTRSAP
jgi:hypothetical protein